MQTYEKITIRDITNVANAKTFVTSLCLKYPVIDVEKQINAIETSLEQNIRTFIKK